MAEAFATSVASNFVSKLCEYLFAPIGRQFGYVLCYKSYVEDLKNGVEKLEAARERVQHSVHEAKNDGKLIENDIKKWLERVENEATQARKLLEHGESAKNACFHQWLPNPVVRHPIGRKVKKKTQVIQRLHDESTNSNFKKVYYENLPIGTVTATTFAARSIDKKEDVLESRASIIEDVVKAIAYDNVFVVGVHGPGGVGKSKLLEDVKRRIWEEKLFDVVVMVNVSRNPDLRKIQGDIAYALGLKLMTEETIDGRADLLHKRLKSDPQKSILIILDNLWKKLELKEVGIPCGVDNKVRGCKILLASRYRDVLRIDMSSDLEFPVNQLENGEARRLFERIVGYRVNDPEFEPWVDGVVKNCGGLPLLIVLLAKRLKHGNLVAWRYASTNIDMSDVESLVEQNYNDLKNERVKSLFLFCALNSGTIYLGHSLVCCMGLGLFEKFRMTLRNARDRLIMDIYSLQDSSLLLDSDNTKLFKIHDMVKFRMHDIFVDVAISISSMKWNALVGRKDFGFKEWSEDELRKCTAISILYVGIDELPEKLDCPNLRILLLAESNPSLRIPKSFFESMQKLQVLDLTCLSFTLLPSSIEFLENLNSLCLYDCHLEDVTVLGKLKGLQFLIFQGSTIAWLPKEIGELTKLRFLDLTSCTKLKVIEPDVLGSLVNLEELYMEDSFDQWEAKDEAQRNNASLAELKNMKKLSTLYIAIPQIANLSSDLPFGKLDQHKIQIGDVWDWSDKYKESRTLKLKLDSDNLLLEEWVQTCLQRTQDLHLDGLQDVNDNIHDLCIEGFQELKHLHVQNSTSLQYVVHSTENVPCTAFTRLESLFLKNLHNLENICRGCLAPGSFNKLNIVKVENCGEIKHLFPSSMKRTILQLEEIKISKCHLMQQIVADAEADEIDDDTKVKPCNLRKLTLRNLPKMTSFCKTTDHLVNFFDGQQVSLPWLESLTLSKLPKLEEIWNSQFPSDVSNLKFLKVEDCAFLLSIFPSNLVIKLQNLEAITVERCQVIRKLFDLEGLIISGDVEILLRLTTLTLSDLPRLEHIWNKNPRIALCFRNLRVLKVQNCENLRFIFSSPVAKALQQIKEIKIARCKLLEEVIDVQEEELEKATSIDTLEFPLLSSLSLEELPNLITFSHGTHHIHCRTLTRLRISRCPRLMTFSSFEGKQQMIPAHAGLQQAFGGVSSSLSLPILFDQNILFPSLEDLTLVSCGLMKIWHNELSKESFRKLASITVQDCENLSHIFPSTSVERFRSLKMIEVVKCTSLEALMEHTAVNIKKRQKHQVFLDSKEVKLWDLPRLDALVTSSSQAMLSLPSLTTISLRNCHSLRYLFTYDTSMTLDKLEMLHVYDCNKMQEVVAMEESEERKLKAVKFSHLHTLKLCSLKSLISFSSISSAFEFPSLTNLSILECIELKAFMLRQPAPRVETINEESTGSNESSHSLFDEKVEFPSMESMKISHMDNIEKIWLDELASNAFTKLKKLIVEYCGKLSSIFSSDSILTRFRNLEKLKVTDCDSLEVVFQMQELNMSGSHSTSTFQLRKLKLKRLQKLKHVWSGPPCGTFTFECLWCLKAKNCESLKSLFPVSIAKSMTQLKELLVQDCGVEEIIAVEGEVGTSVGDLFFPQLTDLRLLELPELRRFYRNSHALTWPLLKKLRARHCGKMRLFSAGTTTGQNQPTLFPFEEVIPNLVELTLTSEDVMMMMQQHHVFRGLTELELACYHIRNVAFPSDFLLHRFPDLEVLSLSCSSLEEIFLEDACGHGGATSYGELTDMETALKALKNLRRLELNKLCKLQRIWKDGSLMAEILKQIETLLVSECSSLSIILPSSTAFQRLRRLEVKDCASLVHMGTCSAVTSLVHLTWLILRNCGAMKDVVTGDGNGVEEISFPNLWQLILDGLPSLESFSSVNCAFTFPSLCHIIVKQCPKMNIFCNGALSTPILHRVFLSDEHYEGRWEGDLNTTIQFLSTGNNPR